MDVEKLESMAMSTVGHKIQKRLTEEAALPQALQELDHLQGFREKVFRGLASIALHHSAEVQEEGMVRHSSKAIRVGTLTIDSPSGEPVRRGLYGVVQNGYWETEAENPEQPDKVYVTFSVKAEEGDIERRLFSTAEIIGQEEVDGELSPVFGQCFASEEYEARRAPAPEGVEPSPGTNMINLSERPYEEGHPDTATDARNQIAAITAELPAMQATLKLLEDGIRQAQSAVL